MNTKLMMIGALATACTALELAAMPTEEETKRAEPVVQRMLAPEKAALDAGKKTRSEVAAAAMKLADKAEIDATRLLLMKGAFILYVQDGNLEKAVETLNALKAAIPDIPPQSVTNIVETALLGVSDKIEAARLYKLMDESSKARNSVASILKGMIKVPGRDYWLSETELTQGQWEAVMGSNLSEHKGVNLPVENVSRDDCDVFLEKLNQTEEVKSSQFEFCLPDLGEWKYAAWAGSAAMRFSSSPASNVLDMAWVKENSLNQTHAVASKAPNAFGFYDMFGNVWEWLSGDAPGGRGALKGCAFTQVADKCTWNQNLSMPKTQRSCLCGLRLAAHIRPQPTFALNAAAGSVTELNLGNVPPLQFVYCPAGKFSMGYKEQPALSKVKDIEITSPFWVSKTVIRADQMEALGIITVTNDYGAAVVNDASIVVKELPSVLKERFGRMIPPGYVFRLPTEAEFEYLQKAEKKDGDGQTNIWGVERLYSGGLIALLDRAPAYGRGVDVVNRWHDAKAWTDLVKVNYENQPDKDPVGWSDDPNWSVFRRGFDRNSWSKLLTTQRNSNYYGFYFVVAPDVDKLNKFYWK